MLKKSSFIFQKVGPHALLTVKTVAHVIMSESVSVPWDTSVISASYVSLRCKCWGFHSFLSIQIHERTTNCQLHGPENTLMYCMYQVMYTSELKKKVKKNIK